MLKAKFLILLITALSLPGYTAAQNQAIVNSLAQISEDSLMHFTRQLCGEEAVSFNGSDVYITSRFISHPGNELASKYIKSKLASFGLPAKDQYFSSGGKNVYAEQQGYLYPLKKYYICAHYDAIWNGADDNASGTAAVLEIARVFSGMSFPYTIVYVLFDEEESGMNGSKDFAQAVDNSEFAGAINMDMIGWNSDSILSVNLHSRDIKYSNELAGKMLEANELYGLNLQINVQDPAQLNSDYASFWQYNLSAIGLSEDYSNDFNKYYHTKRDSSIHIDKSYFHKCVQLAAATLGSLCMDSDFALQVSNFEPPIFNIYPNPTTDEIQITFKPLSEKLEISVLNKMGKELLKNELPALPGRNSLTISLAVLPPATYYLQIKSGSTHRIFKIIRF